MEPIIPQKGKTTKKPFILVDIFLAITIYSVFFPLLLADIWVSIYQFVYFPLVGIPKIKRSDYFTFDRWDLKKLNLWQKINCLYCEYANGVTAYIKAVTNQTEIYSCAIKNYHLKQGKEHQKEFYEYEEFK